GSSSAAGRRPRLPRHSRGLPRRCAQRPARAPAARRCPGQSPAPRRIGQCRLPGRRPARHRGRGLSLRPPGVDGARGGPRRARGQTAQRRRFRDHPALLRPHRLLQAETSRRARGHHHPDHPRHPPHHRCPPAAHDVPPLGAAGPGPPARALRRSQRPRLGAADRARYHGRAHGGDPRPGCRRAALLHLQRPEHDRGPAHRARRPRGVRVLIPTATASSALAAIVRDRNNDREGNAFMTAPFPTATITGYPRIGARRAQKRALESFWAGRIDAEDFARSVHTLRIGSCHRLAQLGLREDYAIPASYSHYDHVLDTALTVGLSPSATTGTDFDLDEYFALAGGTAQRSPLEMTKWFDTNYHYLVPELSDDTRFTAHPQHLLSLVSEAKTAGHLVRPVLVGPLTLLALTKPAPGTPTRPLDRLAELTDVYLDIIGVLAAAGVEWVQFDEPALVADIAGTSDHELAEAARRTYSTLA